MQYFEYTVINYDDIDCEVKQSKGIVAGEDYPSALERIIKYYGETMINSVLMCWKSDDGVIEISSEPCKINPFTGEET